MARSGDTEWYADGLRFECTMCGACCTGAPGFVSFTDDEARRIAAHLEISVDEFIERYTHDTHVPGAGRSLNEVETDYGFDCVFLDRVGEPGKAICSLYGARPLQCRTFPWWPEHLGSPRAWQRLSRACEGIGRGPLVSLTQIRIERDRAEGRKPGGGSTASTS